MVRGKKDNLRPAWKKGESGNPGGRPKGFAARVKEFCGGEDCPHIAEALAVIAFGNTAKRKAFFGELFTVTARDRISALTELRDSGPGRPTQVVETSPSPVPLFALPNGVQPSVSKFEDK